MASLLWIVFYAALALYIGYGLVLFYHWIRWAHSALAVILSIAAYIGLGIILFVLLGGAATALVI